MIRKSGQAFITVFPTALGWMAGAWAGDKLLGLSFNHADPQKAMTALIAAGDRHTILTADGTQDEATPRQAGWILRLQAFAAGTPDDFSDLVIDDASLTEFQRRVVHYCRRIPAGKVLSYGQLARLAGSPGAARAVGRVMATNRWPLVVPCHRVVGAGGTLGGYSAPDGLAIKRRLLGREGVTFPVKRSRPP